jgi:hypothetical protein
VPLRVYVGVEQRQALQEHHAAHAEKSLRTIAGSAEAVFQLLHARSHGFAALKQDLTQQIAAFSHLSSMRANCNGCSNAKVAGITGGDYSQECATDS